MYHLQKDFSLRNHNTFGIPARAQYFLSINSTTDLRDFLSDHQDIFRIENKLILGGGSNLLFIRDFEGLVLSPEILGFKVLEENDQFVDLEVGAGVIWDDFVALCVNKGWGGVENLSLIPGKVGASPVQNIGAYGVEVESVIRSVNGINFETLQPESFSHVECEFAYRNSLFKKNLLNRFLVTSVVFRLKKNPEYLLEYGALKSEIEKLGETSLVNIRKAVISIRESKLPDPLKVGNAGSFFKNPVVPVQIAKKIKDQYPDVPLYDAGDGLKKIAAGWLIEKAGWKGKSVGNAAVHDKQALVIINKGNATGSEIYKLSEMVCNDVFKIFGIEMEREVNVIG
jgi:UDP-N-acetylmuramate dehydrogenase